MVGADDLIEYVGGDEDHRALLESLEAAAIDWLQDHTGLYLGAAEEHTTAELYAAGGIIQLPDEPLGDVVLERWAGSGWEVVGATDYRVDGSWLRTNVTHRATVGRYPYRATYERGYELLDGTDDVLEAPESVKQAVRMLVEHWFVNRGAVVVGTISKELELAVLSIVRAKRRTVA